MTENIILVITPSEYEETKGLGTQLTHMAYRISRSGRLMRSNYSHNASGGYLGIYIPCDAEYRIDAGILCRDIIAEITGRSYKGVFADFFGEMTKELSSFLRELDRAMAVRELELYVSDRLAALAPSAKLLISSEVTQGSYEKHLSECTSQERQYCLELVPLCVDYKLPSKSGEGTPLTREELGGLMERLNPQPFFSRELCAKYFTYMSLDRCAHFVLFDDAYTISAKIARAAAQGITPSFLLNAEMSGFLPTLLVENE